MGSVNYNRTIETKAIILLQVVLQAGRSDLTCLLIIRKAIQNCQDFPWTPLDAILPGKIDVSIPQITW